MRKNETTRLRVCVWERYRFWRDWCERIIVYRCCEYVCEYDRLTLNVSLLSSPFFSVYRSLSLSLRLVSPYLFSLFSVFQSFQLSLVSVAVALHPLDRSVYTCSYISEKKYSAAASVHSVPVPYCFFLSLFLSLPSYLPPLLLGRTSRKCNERRGGFFLSQFSGFFSYSQFVSFLSLSVSLFSPPSSFWLPSLPRSVLQLSSLPLSSHTQQVPMDVISWYFPLCVAHTGAGDCPSSSHRACSSGELKWNSRFVRGTKRERERGKETLVTYTYMYRFFVCSDDLCFALFCFVGLFTLSLPLDTCGEQLIIPLSYVFSSSCGTSPTQRWRERVEGRDVSSFSRTITAMGPSPIRRERERERKKARLIEEAASTIRGEEERKKERRRMEDGQRKMHSSPCLSLPAFSLSLVFSFSLCVFSVSSYLATCLCISCALCVAGTLAAAIP